MSIPDFESNNFVNFFESNSEEVINKLSKEPDKLVKLFEFSCNKNNEWYLNKSDSFDNIFKKIEQLNLNGLLNKSQIKQISDISTSIYPSITSNKTKSELIVFLKQTINDDNVYEYLNFFIKNKKMSEAFTCLLFIGKPIGMQFTSFNVAELTLDVEIINPKDDQLTQQTTALNKLSKIFKKIELNLSINEDLHTKEVNFIREFESFINTNESMISNIETIKNIIQKAKDKIKEHINHMQKTLGFKIDEAQDEVIVKIENTSLTPANFNLINSDLSKIYTNKKIKLSLQSNVVERLNQSMKEVENLKTASSISDKILASISDKIKSELDDCDKFIRQCEDFKDLETLNSLENSIEKLIDKINDDMIGIFSLMPNNEMIKAQIVSIRESIPLAIERLEGEKRKIQLEEKERLRQLEDAQLGYLDDYRLLKGEPGSSKIDPKYWQWFMLQAILRDKAQNLDSAQRQQIYQAMLQSYRKAAPFEDAKAQTTPLFPTKERYYRHGAFEMTKRCQDAYAKEMNVQGKLYLISSPLLKEVFARSSQFDLNIGSEEAFRQFVKTFFKAQDVKEKVIPLDISNLLKSKGMTIQDASTEIEHLKKIFLEMLEEQIKELTTQGSLPYQNQGQFRNFMAKNFENLCEFFVLTQHKGQDILLLPDLKKSPSKEVIDAKIEKAGFHISPSQTMQALLKVEDGDTLLRNEKVPLAKLATTGKGNSIPMVCTNYSEFVARGPIQRFGSLSNLEKAPPYVRVLAEATVDLLRGLEGFDIDKSYKDKGLQDLLQISYERILNACGEAVLRREDYREFVNQLEIIHQEIQTILTIVAPYGKTDFADTVVANLTGGQNPVIPSDLARPNVYLKTSGMQTLASTLAGIEAEKGTNKLNVLVLKDSYFESNMVIEGAQTYKKTMLAGDKLEEKDKIEEALFTGKWDKMPPENVPIDVFLCEFHHNWNPYRSEYHTENIAKQIKALNSKGFLADKCTVVIDNTIDLEQSDHLRNLLADPEIHTLIKDGKLNIALGRSAVKFDMLGFDNYYGGIVTTINNPQRFNKFNERMAHPQDQLTDVNYQGLTHLQKQTDLDAYRKAIRETHKTFYKKIPDQFIEKPGDNPSFGSSVKIAKMSDDNLFFIDFKFTENRYRKERQQLKEVFRSHLMEFAKKHHLPLTSRGSFGFANANYTPEISRLTFGLEDEKTIDLYVEFFKDFASRAAWM